MRKYILYISLLFVGVSCESSIKEDSDAKVIAFDLDNRTQAVDTSLFSSAEVVFLQTTKESLIEDISKVIFGDSTIVIVDSRRNRVLFFDYDGKFIRSFSKIGRGHGEYVQFVDAALDLRSGNLVLCADIPRQLMYYDLNGNFIKGEKYEEPIVRITDTSDGLVMLNRYLDKDSAPYAVLLKNDGRRCDMLEHSIHQSLDCYVAGSNLVGLGDRALITQRYDNNIYEIRNGKLHAKYSLDFGKYDVNSILSESNDEIFDNSLHEGAYVYGIVNVKENERFLLLRTNCPGIGVYDKYADRAEYLRFINLQKERISLSRMLPSDNDENRVAFLLDTHQLMGLKSQDKTMQDLRPAEFAARLAQVDENDNPAIVVCKLKQTHEVDL